MAVSEQLKQAIVAFGTGTAYSAAKASGVDVRAVDRFLSGERGLYSESIDKLCEAMGLELRPIKSKRGK